MGKEEFPLVGLPSEVGVRMDSLKGTPSAEQISRAASSVLEEQVVHRLVQPVLPSLLEHIPTHFSGLESPLGEGEIKGFERP